ncbi:MAG: DUF5615 family PIN-like protein [Chloroflexi bacterium]|nr:DUF5615 family PIN-like protein [Chloroflexota bacterium]
MERLYIVLYFDENIASQIAKALAQQNYDVLTARQAGMLGKSDDEQFHFAISEQRTLVTHDREDYLNLHSQYLTQGIEHYGLIILIERKRIGEIIARLLDLLENTTADEIKNQLRFI